MTNDVGWVGSSAREKKVGNRRKFRAYEKESSHAQSKYCSEQRETEQLIKKLHGEKKETEYEILQKYEGLKDLVEAFRECGAKIKFYIIETERIFTLEGFERSISIFINEKTIINLIDYDRERKWIYFKLPQAMSYVLCIKSNNKWYFGHTKNNLSSNIDSKASLYNQFPITEIDNFVLKQGIWYEEATTPTAVKIDRQLKLYRNAIIANTKVGYKGNTWYRVGNNWERKITTIFSVWTSSYMEIKNSLNTET